MDARGGEQPEATAAAAFVAAARESDVDERARHAHAPPIAGPAHSGYLNRDDVTARVIEVVKKFDKVDQSKVTPTSNFKADLGLDSLDETEAVMAFEEEFNIDIPDAEADKIKSLEDAINFVTADPNAK